MSLNLGPAPGFCSWGSHQPPAAVGAQGRESLPPLEVSSYQLLPPAPTVGALFHKTQLLCGHSGLGPELCVEEAGDTCSCSILLSSQFFLSQKSSISAVQFCNCVITHAVNPHKTIVSKTHCARLLLTFVCNMCLSVLHIY